MKLPYTRVVLKLSGEALMGASSHGLDPVTLHRIAADLVASAALGVEIALVVGGGNFFRGLKQGVAGGLARARADSMGMLATIMNGLALEQAIEEQGCSARLLSAIPMPTLCETYSRAAALQHLKKGRIAVLVGGTGNPFFTTDTGAVLRAAELSAQCVLKATQVDGVYTADPKKDPQAVRYARLTHREAMEKSLSVMDMTAFALAQENRMPILVFSILPPHAIREALEGRAPATIVEP